MFEDILDKIIIAIVSGAILALLTYLVRTVRATYTMLQKHEKILFGDSDIQEWEGIVKIAIANRKYTIADRRAFIALVSTLCKTNTIILDDDLRDAIDTLKKE